MSKPVVESARIVIKTDDGNRLALEGKGSAPRVMLTAFGCLPQDRREWLLKYMHAEHEKLLAKAAERAAPTPAAEPGDRR